MSRRHGVFYGVGVGPGDPELLTLKAARIIAEADVVAYPANPDGVSLARTIAQTCFSPGTIEVPIPMDAARGRESAEEAYDAATPVLLGHLAAGRSVAALCEGDPLLYGSFAHILQRLPEGTPVEAVPGVPALTACAAVAGRALAQGRQTLLCLPATLCESALARALEGVDAAAVFKVGRHLPKAAAALEAAGLAAGATVVVRAGQPGQRVLSLSAALDGGVPYFSLILARRSVPATCPP